MRGKAGMAELSDPAAAATATHTRTQTSIRHPPHSPFGTFVVVGEQVDEEEAQDENGVFGELVKLDDLEDGQREGKLGDGKGHEARQVRRLAQRHLLRLLELVPEAVLQRHLVVLAVLAQLEQEVPVKRVVRFLLPERCPVSNLRRHR